MVTARVGIYDGYAYPWGFGVSPESGMTPDLTEPIRLVRDLHNELGLNIERRGIITNSATWMCRRIIMT